jgi:hypothetical protein
MAFDSNRRPLFLRDVHQAAAVRKLLSFAQWRQGLPICGSMVVVRQIRRDLTSVGSAPREDSRLPTLDSDEYRPANVMRTIAYEEPVTDSDAAHDCTA